MKLLLSAYACEPGKGSEPEVGLQTALAAARNHDVWVVTRANNVSSLQDFLHEHPRGERITVVGLEASGTALRLKKRHRLMGQLYYDVWQRAVAERATVLDRRIRFDVTHHVTFAAYWMRAGVAKLQRPFVWGPVGGGVSAPHHLYPELGARGLADEVGRSLVRPVVAALPGFHLQQRRAHVVMTQNVETGERIRHRRTHLVVPNALAASVSDSVVPPSRNRTVVSVARMVPWKGTRLAVRAFAAADVPDARMILIGSGVELPRLRRLVDELGITDRVQFAGRLPRSEVLRVVAGAGVLIHAALHEEAGLAVSEALSYGTPVVCLDRGGPPELLRYWPHVPSQAVRPTSRTATVAGLAAGIVRCLSQPPPTGVREPVRTYEDVVLEAYSTAVDAS